MNKTKIDWCDYSWNPVTGCLHGCEYCYARKIANRFGGNFAPIIGEFEGVLYDGDINGVALDNGAIMYDLHKPVINHGRKQPYPAGFMPTFHRYRLDEPQKIKKSQNIFVCSMSDLFGDWVPDEWIEEVFKACSKAPQHRYLFLTKNPKGLRYPFHQYFNNKNWWVGTSVKCNADHQRAWDLLQETTRRTNKFISIEPLHDELDLEKYELLCKGYPKIATIGDYYNWVIIGAETGNRKGKITPKKEWIDKIVYECRTANVPVFMKESLLDLMGQDFIQEFPW